MDVRYVNIDISAQVGIQDMYGTLLGIFYTSYNIRFYSVKEHDQSSCLNLTVQRVRDK